MARPDPRPGSRRPAQQSAQLQRNALAPAIIAAITLLVAPAIIATDWFTVVRFVVAILALIIGWFAVQAGQWWWAVVAGAIAVLWNPVIPFAFDGLPWTIAQPLAGAALMAAGVLVTTTPPASAARG